MVSFIPHYYYPLDPFAVFVLGVVLGCVIIGWLICMYVDRRK